MIASVFTILTDNHVDPRDASQSDSHVDPPDKMALPSPLRVSGKMDDSDDSPVRKWPWLHESGSLEHWRLMRIGAV